MKICKTCQEDKPDEDFYKNGNDTFRPECKECHKNRIIRSSAGDWDSILQVCLEYSEPNPKKMILRLCNIALKNRKKKAS